MPKRKLKQNEFYCVSCRKPVRASVDDIKFKVTRLTRRPMLKSYCRKCDCNLNKFVKESQATSMRRKYGAK